MHAHTPRCAKREMRNTQNHNRCGKMFTANEQCSIILLFNEPHHTFKYFFSSEFYAWIKWLIIRFNFSSISFQMNIFCKCWKLRKNLGISSQYLQLFAKSVLIRIRHTKSIWRMSTVSSLWIPAEQTTTKKNKRDKPIRNKRSHFISTIIMLVWCCCRARTKRIT